MKTKATLKSYVKKRNGVALGHRHSLKNMLERAFGAGSFRGFWQHWNPIWGYYLSFKITRPLSQILPIEVAILVTFLVSGAIHDLAISLVKQEQFFFSVWFTIMGFYTLLETRLNISYRAKAWPFKAALNLTIITLCWWFTEFLISIYR